MARLDRYVQQTGVTRAHVVEQALLHHLQALEELPQDAVTPIRIVLNEKRANQVRSLITHLPEPTEEMKRLFDDR